MKKISIQSPTRVDLAGGTLDMWPLYNFVHGAKTINVAISVWTRVELEELSGSEIRFESRDLKAEVTYALLKEALEDKDPKWGLFRAQLRYWQPQGGFVLRASSESPVGGGLGGSSSLTISLMKAFSQWTGRQFKTSHEMVFAAHNIEAELLNTPTGTQDYYPAVSGGINILTYKTDGIHQQVLPVQGSALADYFMLIYTGKSHHSGLNNFEVLKGAVSKDPEVMAALHDIKVIAEDTALAVSQGDYHQLPNLFKREYAARVKLCAEFSSPEIVKLHELSLANGASALKICGAGGGGCVLVWCPPENQERVRQACQKAGFQVLGAQPVSPL